MKMKKKVTVVELRINIWCIDYDKGGEKLLSAMGDHVNDHRIFKKSEISQTPVSG